MTHTADPLGGSYFVESLTNEIETRAWEYLEKVDGMGGSVPAIEAGWMQAEIHEAAFRIQQAVESGERVVVGVNRFTEPDDTQPELQALDPNEVEAQKERLRRLRSGRDQSAVDRALAEVTDAAKGTANLLPPMRKALRLGATLGEVSDALREVFGVHQPSR